MTWLLFELQQDGKPFQLMLEDRFKAVTPGDELPTLSRLRVWCAKDPGDFYWHPDESTEIDKIEDDILRLADQYGEGWVVYVHRRAVPGCLDYFFYSGGDAALDQVVPALQAAHPGYRFDYEASADPAWEKYAGWFSEAAAGTENPGLSPASDPKLN